MKSIWILLIFIFFIIFLSLFVFSGIIISSSIDPTPIPPTPIIPDNPDNNTLSCEGIFSISNNNLNYLANITSLRLTKYNPNYIKKVNNIGIQFQPGIYDIKINFNLTSQNYTNGSFNCYLFICNSPNISNYTYDNVENQVNGPQFLQHNQISFCPANLEYPSFKKYLQSNEKTISGILCPLIVFSFSCKSDKSDTCYSNYYSLSCTINVITEDIYYFSTAFNSNGSLMKGNGNIFIKINI